MSSIYGDDAPKRAKEFAQEILESPEYRDSIRSRARLGTMHPSIEKMLWAYGYGKPVDVIKIDVTGDASRIDLTTATDEQLAARAKELAQLASERAGLTDEGLAARTAVSKTVM